MGEGCKGTVTTYPRWIVMLRTFTPLVYLYKCGGRPGPSLLFKRPRRHAAAAVAGRRDARAGVAGDLQAVAAEAGVAAVEDGRALGVGRPSAPIPILEKRSARQGKAQPLGRIALLVRTGCVPLYPHSCFRA